MKPPWEWNEQDILGLIADQVKEDLNLDYKACDSLAKSEGKKKEISKDVSAFANSAGGVIVYGVTEDNHLPTGIDSGYDPADISKEWVEQVINSNIKRRIDGVRINQLELRTTKPGKVIYVVSIPQSNRAPHMASDHRFYKRFNFESVPMEEYEVRDVARRLETPDLRLVLWPPSGTNIPLHFESATSESGPIALGISITNDSPQPAEHILIFAYLDERLRVHKVSNLTVRKQSHIQVGDRSVEVTLLQMNWSLPRNMPVWDGTNFSVTDIQLTIPNNIGEQYVIGWEVKAPRMTPKRGYHSLVSTGSVAFLLERS